MRPLTLHLLLITLLSWAANVASKGDSGAPADSQVLQRFVDESVIAGAVTAVVHGESTQLSTVGFSDLEKRVPMQEDALFWIASMTKPMTGVAIMMLQDEGKLSVEDPVEKYLPEFKNQWMIRSKKEAEIALVPAPRAIIIRDLLTHTSGLGDLPAPRTDCTLAELAMAYSQRPLQFAPGSKWQYSNGGINTLGRIVEVVSGKDFAAFLQERLFDPLEMKETTFWPSTDQVKRLAKSYRPGEGGAGLEPVPIFFIKGELTDRNRTAYPAGGLFSTAADVANFYRMMLGKGVYNQRRVLSEKSVAALTQTQTGDIKTGFVDGMSWGLGFQVVKEPKGVTSMLSKGAFGHGGAYGTQSWADPAMDVILILMIQRAGLPNADASEIRRAFQEAAISKLREVEVSGAAGR